MTLIAWIGSIYQIHDKLQIENFLLKGMYWFIVILIVFRNKTTWTLEKYYYA